MVDVSLPNKKAPSGMPEKGLLAVIFIFAVSVNFDPSDHFKNISLRAHRPVGSMAELNRSRVIV